MISMGWGRLMRRSWAIGLAWLARVIRTGRLVDARQGLYRLLVPLEPWRFYELGHVASASYEGRWLDVGSPKLLASSLQAAGRGEWVAVDLFSDEIERWRRLDPRLDLRVEDARSLSFADGTFDGCACISVVEHIPDGGDAKAMAEIWRVLRPGGMLRLSTNITARPEELLVDEPIYGEASEGRGERLFFERRYTEASLRARLLGLPWEVVRAECVRERLPVHRLFFATKPFSFLLGNALALVCPLNARRIPGPSEVPNGTHGVVSLTLRKPASDAGVGAARGAAS